MQHVIRVGIAVNCHSFDKRMEEENVILNIKKVNILNLREGVHRISESAVTRHWSIQPSNSFVSSIKCSYVGMFLEIYFLSVMTSIMSHHMLLLAKNPSYIP